MLTNALIGALGVLALHQLVRAQAGAPTALIAALLAALHPGLVAYTPAIMTEGVTAALLCGVVWATTRARDDGLRWWALASLLLGAATLVRPQCLLLAPVVGAIGVGRHVAARRRWWGALAACVMALCVCLPWTLRNCARMDRCALVSVNGGWNLLIGTQPEGSGGWAPIAVPEACRDVFGEADKDACFAREARQRIAADPWAWLALAPRKLDVTMDYCGAGGWYLHDASPELMSARAKAWLGGVETLFDRSLLMLALLAAWGGVASLRWRIARVAVLALGLASAAYWHASLAWLSLVVLLVWRRGGLSRRPLFVVCAALVSSVMLVHAVFFGSGRYQLVVWLLMCGVAALGLTRFGRLARAASGALRRRP
jgi:hypothetical protein